jgi:2-(1,2-epoxy-1,2-dihydrophenyl)acetyl-CoA isomerase
MSDPTVVRLDVQDGLATVTLSQPARGNPFDGAFVKRMKEIFLELWETQDLRAVLIRAEGPNFSVGGDLKSFYPQRDKLAAVVRSWTADLHMGLQRAWQLPVPIVAEVQGFAMGGGVALFAGADVVLASQSAKIGSAFCQIGFSCDSGTTAVLTPRMGAARAKRFVMLGEVLTSEQALQVGLVDKVVADELLSAEALALVRKLANGPTLAYGEVKRLFHRASAIQMESLLEDEALTLARVAGSWDAQEGIAAMVEKRKPAFQGR